MKDSEVSYCVDAIKQGPTNESPWKHLKGLFLDDQATFVKDSLVIEVCISETLKDLNNVPALRSSDCWFPTNIWLVEDVAKGLADVGVTVLAGGCCVHQT